MNKKNYYSVTQIQSADSTFFFCSLTAGVVDTRIWPKQGEKKKSQQTHICAYHHSGNGQLMMSARMMMLLLQQQRLDWQSKLLNTHRDREADYPIPSSLWTERGRAEEEGVNQNVISHWRTTTAAATSAPANPAAPKDRDRDKAHSLHKPSEREAAACLCLLLPLCIKLPPTTTTTAGIFLAQLMSPSSLLLLLCM